MAHLLNQTGSLEDVRNTIRCSWSRIQLQSLQDALQNEKANQNRSTVIKLLQSSLNKKQKETKA